MKQFSLVLCLTFASLVAVAGDENLDAVSSLKADLDAVVELNQVYPVEGVTTAGD